MHPPVNVRAAVLGAFVASGVIASVDVDGVVSDDMRKERERESS